MKYSIRKTLPHEVDIVLSLFEEARAIMRADGNMHQWTGGEPRRELVEHDIAQGNSYLMLDATGHIVATFAFIVGVDPTYIHIYEGAWLDADSPYGVVHRLASKPLSRGVAQACFDWCFQQVPNLKIDTHRDNHIMQHVLLKAGFQYCGIIYLLNGDERLAFQKVKH
ncbi:MAG: GNAT family N-acetyltransferase [Bacteroidaceae bacterium]|nr:GNAT family N-acetyltransferase [Bacteroidaceae bacterium]MBR3014394.1 GNAT family N-acetyltransferase [Bacteroidaceae bacterium]MBR3626386.1 GNAT family N-acetyltransferase [Bacteroidaceae bacterium]